MNVSNAEYMRNYRLNRPEFREKEKERDTRYTNNKYMNDEEYKQRKRDRALEYYYKKKERMQANQAVETV